jgi:hypothetical protein
MLTRLITTYNDTVLPILDMNDKLVSKVVPNSAFSMIADVLDESKEKALGVHVGDYEDLQVIQDEENRKRKKRGELYP